MVMQTQLINSKPISDLAQTPSSGVKSLAARMAQMQPTSGVAPSQGGDLTAVRKAEFLKRLSAANPKTVQEIMKLLRGMNTGPARLITFEDQMATVGSCLKELQATDKGLYDVAYKTFIQLFGIVPLVNQIKDQAFFPSEENGGVVPEY